MWLLSYLSNDLGLSRSLIDLVWNHLPNERIDYEITKQLKLEYGRVAAIEHRFADKTLQRLLECSGHVMVVDTFWTKTRQCFFNVQSESGGYCYRFKHMNEAKRHWEIVSKREWHHYAHAMLKMYSFLTHIMSHLENRYGWWMTQVARDKLFKPSVMGCSVGRIHDTMLVPPYTGFLFIHNGDKITTFAFQRLNTYGKWQYLRDGIQITSKKSKEEIAVAITETLEHWSDVIRYPNNRLASTLVKTNASTLLQTLKREQGLSKKSHQRDASPVRGSIN